MPDRMTYRSKDLVWLKISEGFQSIKVQKDGRIAAGTCGSQYLYADRSEGEEDISQTPEQV